MRPAVDPRFGAELHRLRTAVDLSQQALADAAHTTKGHISDLEHGTRRPSPRLAVHLDQALDAGGRLTGMVAVDHPLNPDEDDRLDYATARPRHVDATVLDSLTQVLGGQRRLDDALGSAAVLPSATASLDVVTRLVVEATGPLRARVVDVASQWAQFGGWLHTTGARWEQAQTWFSRALDWATEAGSTEMVATVLSYQGHVAWLTGRPGPVVGLSRAALRDDSVYVGQRAYDAFQAARGHAVLGETAEALALVGLGDDLAQRTAEWAGPVPAWHYYREPWFFRLERGLVFRYLGRTDRSRAEAAVLELTAGMDGMPAEWRTAEWAAEYEAHLAGAHAQLGDLPAARTVAAGARRVATATSSARVLAMIERLERHM